MIPVIRDHVGIDHLTAEVCAFIENRTIPTTQSDIASLALHIFDIERGLAAKKITIERQVRPVPMSAFVEEKTAQSSGSVEYEDIVKTLEKIRGLKTFLLSNIKEPNSPQKADTKHISTAAASSSAPTAPMEVEKSERSKRSHEGQLPEEESPDYKKPRGSSTGESKKSDLVIENGVPVHGTLFFKKHPSLQQYLQRDLPYVQSQKMRILLALQEDSISAEEYGALRILLAYTDKLIEYYTASEISFPLPDEIPSKLFLECLRLYNFDFESEKQQFKYTKEEFRKKIASANPQEEKALMLEAMDYHVKCHKQLLSLYDPDCDGFRVFNYQFAFQAIAETMASYHVRGTYLVLPKSGERILLWPQDIRYSQSLMERSQNTLEATDTLKSPFQTVSHDEMAQTFKFFNLADITLETLFRNTPLDR